MDQEDEIQSIEPIQNEPQWADAPLWVNLYNAAELLTTDAAAAERQVREILGLVPGEPHAVRLLVDAIRAQGDVSRARAELDSLRAEFPKLAIVHLELGLLLSEIGEREGAIRALFRTVELEPNHHTAWRTLGDELVNSGDTGSAAKAYERQFASSIVELKTLENVSALGPDQADAAATMAQEFLKIYPTDLFAIHAIGRMYLRANRFETAEKLFAHALELAPDFGSARQDYLSVLHQQQKWQAKIGELDKLLEEEPDNPDYRFDKAVATLLLMNQPEALRLFDELLRDYPDEGKFWAGYANVLRSIGRRDECIAAYRKSVQLRPDLGAGWWGLADLMGFDLSAADFDVMHAQLARADLAEEDRYYLHFALGEALEAKQSYRESFEHYCKGNALRRAGLPYRADDMTANVQHIKRHFTRDFIQARAASGCVAPDPIFIVGLPRSGSTLVEQILSSHASIEGAGELPVLAPIAARLEVQDTAGESSGEVETPARARQNLGALGEEYLKGARVYRRLGRPFFTDKTPSNFHHIWLISAIFPNAKIIDVRRHPVACCFSNFKQLFPWGLPQTYDLTDIARYYRDYVELMAHFDAVLPGRIHRVFYEDLIGNTEQEARRLFDYCGLAFEPRSLCFYENERVVVTISSEQVRQPIYDQANEQWRHYERWLDPLKAALGSLPEIYPAVPDRF
jgi:predicted Zn-dependent protease